MTDTTGTGAETALRELAERHGITLMCDSQASLSPAMRALHQAILTAFVDTGAAPTTDRVADQATDLDLDVDNALAAFAAADLVHVHGEESDRGLPVLGRPHPAPGPVRRRAGHLGDVCDQATSVEIGRIVFGSLLAEPWE